MEKLLKMHEKRTHGNVKCEFLYKFLLVWFELLREVSILFLYRLYNQDIDIIQLVPEPRVQFAKRTRGTPVQAPFDIMYSFIGYCNLCPHRVFNSRKELMEHTNRKHVGRLVQIDVASTTKTSAPAADEDATDDTVEGLKLTDFLNF